MELLQSEKFKLPTLYFITDRDEIKDIPVGVPFIYGKSSDKKYLIRILEYEILYQEAVKTGYPFNFRKILQDAGYKDLKIFDYHHPLYMDYKTEGLTDKEFDIDSKVSINKDDSMFKEYIKDSAVYVDVQKLKALNVFPLWLDTIEEAVHTNIHNFAVFNHNMYNKKLDGMYGAMELTSPGKNLIIIDISGSIPKGVSSTCLTLAKNLAETFYSDLLITGTISTLYPYEEINTLDIETIYEVNGMDNDAIYFRNIVSNDERCYKTAIVFGDNHSPCDSWQGSGSISREDAKKLCKWKIDKLISFHTNGTYNIAGYADMFSPKEVEKIKDWVKYLV